jgi:hypothetical protein
MTRPNAGEKQMQACQITIPFHSKEPRAGIRQSTTCYALKSHKTFIMYSLCPVFSPDQNPPENRSKLGLKDDRKHEYATIALDL